MRRAHLTIEVRVPEKLKVLLEKVSARCADIGPVTPKIATLMKGGVDRHFRDQGMPMKWKPSVRAKRESGMTLQDTGHMKRSVRKGSEKQHAAVYVTTKGPRGQGYAILHQEGHRYSTQARMTGTSRWARWRRSRGLIKGFAVVPRRPFMTPNPPDEAIHASILWRIVRVVQDFLFKSAGRLEASS